MSRFFILLATTLFLSVANAFSETNAVLRTALEFKAFRAGLREERRNFDLTGTVTLTQANGTLFVLEDETGRIPLFCADQTAPTPGSVIHVTGTTRINNKLEAWDFPEEMTILGERQLPPPKAVRIGEIDEVGDDWRMITTEGTVIDILADEIDSRYVILTILDGTALIPVFTARENAEQLRQAIGARIGITGIYLRGDTNSRTFILPFISVEKPDNLRLLSLPKADFSDVPELLNMSGRTPEDLKKLGHCKLTGEVLATWGGNQVMLRSAENFISNIQLIRGCPLPEIGQRIVVAGYPETDFFRLNLGKARWIPAGTPAAPANETPQPVKPQDILGDAASQYTMLTPGFHGRLITITGQVRTITTEGGAARQAILSCGDSTLLVDYSSTPDAFADVTVGCVIEATGRCLLMISNYTQYERFPQITGVALVPRTPQDIRVVARPSWWTPARLLGVIAGLVALLAGCLIWNRVLNRLVERRSRELFRVEVAKVSSELRIGERTRLAVELHDSLSQNLTGVAMKITAAKRCGKTDADGLFHHLDIAEKALQSCRDELRNSLWDLRNQALEDTDLNRAISRTLLPHIENVQLSVRFNVRRSLLTDNTTHDILRIIRELAVNGIRHGKATAVKIAGSIEGDTLLFSVTDNGQGFDPANCPGVREGHFGLQGVRERLGRFSGTLTLESAPEKGTRAVVTLHLPTPPKKENEPS